MPASESNIVSAPAAEPVPVKPSHWRRISALIVVCLMLIWMLRNLILGTPVQTFTVHIANLTQTVVASGRVITPERVSIATQVAGRVARVAVAEGSEVTNGQLLIELDSSDALAARASARAAVALATAQQRALVEVELPAATQTLGETEANLRQAQKQFDRIADLKARGFVGQAELDTARRDLDVTQSQVRSARLQVQTRQPDGSGSEMAAASLAQAQATLDQAVVRLAQYQILAPVSGVLISRAVERGDIAQPGQELMLLASTGQTLIDVQLDEKNLGKLMIGQAALVSADAYPDERFTANVIYINPGIDASRGAVEIRLEVIAPPAYLRQDMTVSVDVITAQRPAVLVIPTGAVHDLDSKAPWVLVIRAQRAVRQQITLGLLGDDNAEVRSGLKDGEHVIPASAASVLPGAHVRDPG